MRLAYQHLKPACICIAFRALISRNRESLLLNNSVSFRAYFSMRLRVFCIFLFIVFISASSFSQESGVLKGVVFDFDTHEKLPGATIRLGNNFRQGALTHIVGKNVKEVD